MKVSERENTLGHTAAPKLIWPRWRDQLALHFREAETRRRQGTSRLLTLNNNHLQFIASLPAE